MPDFRAVNVFEIQALSISVSIVMAIPLIGQFTQIVQIMPNGDCHIALLGEIPDLFNYSFLVSTMLNPSDLHQQDWRQLDSG